MLSWECLLDCSLYAIARIIHGFHSRKQQAHAATHIEANSADTNMFIVYAAAAAADDDDGASQVRGGDLRVWRNLPPRFVDYFRTFLKQHAEKTWLVSFTCPVSAARAVM
jgi:hypothetical protein